MAGGEILGCCQVRIYTQARGPDKIQTSDSRSHFPMLISVRILFAKSRKHPGAEPQILKISGMQRNLGLLAGAYIYPGQASGQSTDISFLQVKIGN